MYYFDSNIFILPALYDGKKARKAKSLLHDVVRGDIEAATCTLTLDEVTWIIAKESTREQALKEVERILEFPHLEILDVRSEDMISMIRYMRKYDHLNPRDAVHLTVALNNGIHTIVSDDDDFLGIKEISWMKLDDNG